MTAGPLFIRQFYLGCLAQASYLVGSGDEAAVIDPRRDIDIYLDEARARGFKIRHVLETHLHADFVSGHRELAARAGARIYFGRRARVSFDHVGVSHGDEIRMGGALLRFLETPGHTPESVSILAFDAARPDVPEAVFTGDTLFVGDVGRPDLLGAAMSATELAGLLYDSLREKLLILPDGVRVFPGHGAGSMCGRNLSSETSSTIGEQRRFNYALQPMSREAFVAMMTVDLPEAPLYFGHDAAENREGPPLLREIPPPAALDAGVFARNAREGASVLDTRPASAFGAAHVPGSLNIGLDGQFASWAGSLIPARTPILLVAENSERVSEARVRLARVGLENSAGYLDGGLLSWERAGLPLSTTEQISVLELDARIRDGSAGQVVDVRQLADWRTGRIPGSAHHPLSRLRESADALDRGRPVAAICAGGYRSTAATGILEALGFAGIANVVGGISAWTAAGLPVARD